MRIKEFIGFFFGFIAEADFCGITAAIHGIRNFSNTADAYGTGVVNVEAQVKKRNHVIPAAKRGPVVS
jgi:hypothetical protein